MLCGPLAGRSSTTFDILLAGLGKYTASIYHLFEHMKRESHSNIWIITWIKSILNSNCLSNSFIGKKNDRREECGRITQYSPSHRDFRSWLNLNFTLTSIPFMEKLLVLFLQHKSDEDEGERNSLVILTSTCFVQHSESSKTRNIARYGLQWLRYYLNPSSFSNLLCSHLICSLIRDLQDVLVLTDGWQTEGKAMETLRNTEDAA